MAGAVKLRTGHCSFLPFCNENITSFVSIRTVSYESVEFMSAPPCVGESAMPAWRMSSISPFENLPSPFASTAPPLYQRTQSSQTPAEDIAGSIAASATAFIMRVIVFISFSLLSC